MPFFVGLSLEEMDKELQDYGVLKIRDKAFSPLILHTDKGPSAAGLFLFDDVEILVDGYFFVFKSEKNRDTVFQYIKKHQTKTHF